ncbi:hypothetical protein ACFFK0_01555 [Paenibacillus chartarius]|uniref:Uncharacterized protein n=1 Tax=Paenibacillus chartarius TaxID=747481 RepID=A0ABV6DES9_9BACL
MNEENIRELEPKYTGNRRHLSEGEAEAIAHDPANSNSDDDLPAVTEDLPAVGLLGFNRAP